MFTRILVPLDQSPLAEQAIGRATSIAAKSRGEVELVLAHEPTAYSALFEGGVSKHTAAESVYIHALAEEVGRHSCLTVNGTIGVGDPAAVICRRAHDTAAGLIVMTSHGRTGLRRAWLGSVTDAVVRDSPVPVLVLRADDGRGWRHGDRRLFHRVLVPLDGVTKSDRILSAAVEMARLCDAVPILLRIVTPVPLYLSGEGVPHHPTAIMDDEGTRHLAGLARDELTQLAQRIESHHAHRVETEVVVAPDVGLAILEVARSRRVDLIAMASSGRGASRLIVASVTDALLRETPVPLMLLNADSTPAAEPTAVGDCPMDTEESCERC